MHCFSFKINLAVSVIPCIHWRILGGARAIAASPSGPKKQVKITKKRQFLNKKGKTGKNLAHRPPPTVMPIAPLKPALYTPVVESHIPLYLLDMWECVQRTTLEAGGGEGGSFDA